MSILVLAGSRRADGTGHKCRVISAAGGSFEKVFLPELKLERCRQCENNGIFQWILKAY